MSSAHLTFFCADSFATITTKTCAKNLIGFSHGFRVYNYFTHLTHLFCFIFIIKLKCLSIARPANTVYIIGTLTACSCNHERGTLGHTWHSVRHLQISPDKGTGR